ncbi:S8 family peptidase [Rhodanobacter hydrolyticus]|uniref:S8 family serine peptidase n=1 Tax=Rhodanobacter hydrolyticus TaxID=2250595 RepID=A0ABW8J6L0_9GAMM
MSRLWPRLITGCALGLAVCAPIRNAASEPGFAAAQPRVLVMLRMPAPHLRGGDGYAGGDYQVAPEAVARKRMAQALAHEHGLRLLDSWPMPALGLDCFVMQAPANTSTRQLLQALSRDARVESAEPVQRFHVLGAADPLYPLQPTASQWHLAELHAVSTGKGITIAEIDSGVDTTNPDLGGQVAQTRNFVGDGDYRAERHGTEVAGIIVAREGNGVGIAGVAPGARLLALRACWQAADGDASSCDSFTLAKALQYALETRAVVFNLSLAGPHDRLLERLLDVALSRHVTVVAAVDPTATDGGFPASLHGVVAVADEQTSRAVIPDELQAPGADVPTTEPGMRWNFVTGTSFAAAEVSGLVALLRASSPGVGSAALHDALNTGAALGFASLRPAVIDACAAVVRVSGRCSCDCATASASTGAPRR